MGELQAGSGGCYGRPKQELDLIMNDLTSALDREVVEASNRCGQAVTA